MNASTHDVAAPAAALPEFEWVRAHDGVAVANAVYVGTAAVLPIASDVGGLRVVLTVADDEGLTPEEARALGAALLAAADLALPTF